MIERHGSRYVTGLSVDSVQVREHRRANQCASLVPAAPARAVSRAVLVRLMIVLLLIGFAALVILHGDSGRERTDTPEIVDGLARRRQRRARAFRSASVVRPGD